MDWEPIKLWCLEQCGVDLKIDSCRPVGGGCIHSAFSLDLEPTGKVFVKVNSADQVNMFQTELDGLKRLRDTGAIRVPEPIAAGVVGDRSLLVMEWISIHHSRSDSDQANLGRKLAKLHGNLSVDLRYGAPADNYIGTTPQINKWNRSWIEFFSIQRLKYQFALAERKGFCFQDSDALVAAVPEILSSYSVPEPSLLHGDLWSGNVGFDEHGEPVIFDPACYYGDREAEIAFTRMFGGFSDSFYRAYREIMAPPEDEARLHSLYNLYHELNHFNIFGGGYRTTVAQTIRKLLKKRE